MKGRKQQPAPAVASEKPSMKLKLAPVSAGVGPRSEVKFIPPVTLSYESTLSLKPIPDTKAAKSRGKAGAVKDTGARRPPKKRSPLRAKTRPSGRRGKGRSTK